MNCNVCGRELVRSDERKIGACAVCMNEEIEPENMKQKLDELRTLAVKLYEAGQTEKRKQPPEIWGSDRDRKFRDLPSESVAVWDAIAIAATKAK